MFGYFSSPMRWCETKLGYIFLYSPYIVEFWNCITSFIFCFFAIYGYLKHNHLNLNNVPWLFLFSIGITSAWFHATLSFLGQFFDEFSIIMLITYCLRIFFDLNKYLYYFLSLFLAAISWFYPHMSPPILMFLGFCLILTTYFKVTKDDWIWYTSMKIGLLSIATWLIDFICFIHTHMYWHILIGTSVYLMLLFVLKVGRKDLVIKNSYIPYLVKKNN